MFLVCQYEVIPNDFSLRNRGGNGWEDGRFYHGLWVGREVLLRKGNGAGGSTGGFTMELW